jgi:hypothetical protein
MEQVLFWTPRVLSMLFAAFLSLFALDVFSEGYSVGEAILALLIHLIPTYLVVIALAIAWRWGNIGGILFIAVGSLHLVTSRGESWPISGPLLLVGVLFLLDWAYRAKRSTR